MDNDRRSTHHRHMKLAQHLMGTSDSLSKKNRRSTHHRLIITIGLVALAACAFISAGTFLYFGNQHNVSTAHQTITPTTAKASATVTPSAPPICHDTAEASPFLGDSASYATQVNGTCVNSVVIFGDPPHKIGGAEGNPTHTVTDIYYGSGSFFPEELAHHDSYDSFVDLGLQNVPIPQTAETKIILSHTFYMSLVHYQEPGASVGTYAQDEAAVFSLSPNIPLEAIQPRLQYPTTATDLRFEIDPLEVHSIEWITNGSNGWPQYTLSFT